MTELKPCPFCGGEPYIDKFEKGSPFSAKFSYEYSIECKKCYAQTGYHKTEQDCIGSWNTRAKSPEVSQADYNELQLKYYKLMAFVEMRATEFDDMKAHELIKEIGEQ